MRQYLLALACVALTFAALGALFLAPYLEHGFAYPVGFDTAFYVARANVTAASGLDSIGLVRSGLPLLLATLMGLTGQNAFTLEVVAPAILAGAAGLAAAAVIRAALGWKMAWVPFLAVMAWIGFARIGTVEGHHDNLLNAVLVLAALAAACSSAGDGKGAAATGVLLAASGLAHWPFYVYASAVLILALGIFLWIRFRAGDRRVAPAGRLLAAVGAGGALTAVTFLAPPPEGGLGFRLPADVLRRRFLTRLRWPARYLALPLAALGTWVVARTRLASDQEGGRLLLLSLVASWTISVVVAGVLQFWGIPVAGHRVLNYFFAVPLLAGVAVVAGAGRLIRRGGLSVGAGCLGLLVPLVVFGGLAWQVERTRRPAIDARAVEQSAAAGEYLAKYAPGDRAVFLLAPKGNEDRARPGPRWRVLQASVPPEVASQMTWLEGTPSQYLALAARESADAVALVIRRYNSEGFRQAVEMAAPLVSPDVAVVAGPTPVGPPSEVTPPRAATDPGTLLGLSALIVGLLLVAGIGWAIVLLPPDPVLRIILSPALGAASLCLVALAWDRVGLGLWGARAAGPFAMSVALGWAAAWVVRRARTRGALIHPRRRPGSTPQQDQAGPPDDAA